VVAGSSGGSIAATLVSADISAPDAMTIISLLATNKEFNKDKDKGIRQVTLDILPDPLTYQQCNHKLHITVTQVAPTFIKRALVVSEFQSNEDLASAVSASCFIPLWSNMRLTTAFRDTKAIDGGSK
jgi:predicted acylesterase/phospholipase RssA